MADLLLQKQLRQMVGERLPDLEFGDGRTVSDVFMASAKILRNILQDEIYGVYAPRRGWYPRTLDFANALYDEDMLVLDRDACTITIGFKPEYAWHDSYITKTIGPGYQMRGYVPYLIKEGFKIFRSGAYYEGNDYIKRAVDRFGEVKPHWVSVEVIDGFSGRATG